MKAVVDTAVLVSAALAIAANNAAHSRSLTERGLSGDSFELVTSEPMLRELSDVLSRPRLGLSAEQAIAFVERVTAAATFVEIRGLAMGCRDPRDDKVLETALNANSDFVVARDRDLHDARARYSIEKVGIGIRSRPIRVVGVTAFLNALDGPDFSALIAEVLIEV
ncbi:MAG TPA: putative toxin-antitoxin system toxin component, PIN family [Candidatus Elarobacter sp.]|nr:putative toxin-antitoxin system toxin component, PIN family [Candidatus Elarobacter sp.]